MAYGITSKNQIIDANTIANGCKKLEDVASKLQEYGQNVFDYSSVCNANALSADNKSMETNIEEVGNSIKQIGSKLSETAEQIKTIAFSIQGQQYSEYELYLQSLKKNN